MKILLNPKTTFEATLSMTQIGMDRAEVSVLVSSINSRLHKTVQSSKNNHPEFRGRNTSTARSKTEFTSKSSFISSTGSIHIPQSRRIRRQPRLSNPLRRSHKAQRRWLKVPPLHPIPLTIFLEAKYPIAPTAQHQNKFSTHEPEWSCSN